ncbi:unnamed protein product [Dicrocoelium dendriticum]|nr:unnamed protein product [Dicrocoelium dendriticum]CAH8513016.1 unnamed protein product [Dicrocoelium dendriticum]
MSCAGFPRRRSKSIRETARSDEQNPLIEFTPPKAIIAKDVPWDKTPSTCRSRGIQRFLFVELSIPGLKAQSSAKGSINGGRTKRWSLRLFLCKGITTFDDGGCLGFPQIRRTESSWNKTQTESFEVDKWCRGGRPQQPRNGELWYRVSNTRVQVSILTEVSRPNDSVNGPVGSVDSLYSTTDISTNSLSSLTYCPHYFYWDSGKLAHPIVAATSSLLTDEEKVMFYLAIPGAKKKRQVWSDEELQQLSTRSASVCPADSQLHSMIVRRSATFSHKTLTYLPSATESLRPSEVKICGDVNDSPYYQVTLERNPGQSLGLTLVERPVPMSCLSVGSVIQPTTGLFIKQIASGSLADQSKKIRVGDQLLAINSVSVILSPPSSAPRKAAGLMSNGHIRLPETCSSLDTNISVPAVKSEESCAEFSCKSGLIGFTAYPFAIRLLRQAIGPVHLSMRRMEPLRSYVYPCETNQLPQESQQAEQIRSEGSHSMLQAEEESEQTITTHRYPKASIPTDQFTLRIQEEVLQESDSLHETVSRNLCTPEVVKLDNFGTDVVATLEGSHPEVVSAHSENSARNYSPREGNTVEQQREEEDTGLKEIMESNKPTIQNSPENGEVSHNDAAIANYLQWTESNHDLDNFTENTGPKCEKPRRSHHTYKCRTSTFRKSQASGHAENRSEQIDIQSILEVKHEGPKAKIHSCVRRNSDKPIQKVNSGGPHLNRSHDTNSLVGAGFSKKTSGRSLAHVYGNSTEKCNAHGETLKNIASKPDDQTPQRGNPKPHTKLQERLEILEEYFRKHVSTINVQPDSPTDQNEVSAFHDILESLTDEEWQILLRVVMQPDGGLFDGTNTNQNKIKSDSCAKRERNRAAFNGPAQTMTKTHLKQTKAPRNLPNKSSRIPTRISTDGK